MPVWEVLCMYSATSGQYPLLFIVVVALRRDVAGHGKWRLYLQNPCEGVSRALIRRRREMLMRYTGAFIRFVFFPLFQCSYLPVCLGTDQPPRVLRWMWRGRKFNCASGINNALGSRLLKELQTNIPTRALYRLNSRSSKQVWVAQSSIPPKSLTLSK